MDDKKPIKVFVAMPGRTMGKRAAWKDIAEIKAAFLEPIRLELERELRRPVELVIEKDRKKITFIYHSMFSEALESDIYIADLTGTNPNVYLELGVRWALKDRVTIPVCQDIDNDVLFNVAGVRVVPYAQSPGIWT